MPLTEVEQKDARRHFNFYRKAHPTKGARRAAEQALRIWQGSYPSATTEKISEVKAYLARIAELDET